MEKPNRDDYTKYPPGSAGQKKFDDDMDLYNAERRKAGDAAATANRNTGGTSGGVEANKNYGPGYKRETGAAAAPIIREEADLGAAARAASEARARAAKKK